MTYYDDVLFPIDISYGSVGGPGFRSHVGVTDSGVDETVARWSRPRRSWDVAYSVKTPTQIKTLLDFYTAVGGIYNSWRFKPPHDFTTAASATQQHYQGDPAQPAPTSTDVLLGVGDGTTTTFQLRKAYTNASRTAYVPITHPVSGTTVVSLNDETQGAGWTVNVSTGVVTFTVAPTAGVNVKAGCDFNVEARFGEDLDRVLPLQGDTFSTASVRSIPVIEVLYGPTVAEDWIPRGGGRLAFSANVTLVESQGYAWELVPASSGLQVAVEDATAVESGGDHYCFYNAGSDSVTLKGGSTTIASLAAGADCKLVVWKIGGTKTWKAVT